MGDRGAAEEKDELENQNNTNETSRITATLEISDKFWSNDIIWQEITGYLNISDLKDLSCVNHFFLHRVRSITRFTSLSGQVVTGKLEIHVFKLCRAIVLVNQIDDNALEEKASLIFGETEDLEIHCLAKLSDADRNSRLIQIIANCPKLKSLAFGKFSFFGMNIESFLKHSSVKLMLSKLKELHLGFYNNKYIFDNDREQCTDSIRQIQNSDPFQSFKLLSELQMTLVKFSYTFSETEDLASCSFSPELVLSSSQKSLKELNLHVPFGSTLGLQNMKFPKLEKFSLILNNELNYANEIFNQLTFDTNFALFLKNHLSSLTHFEVDSPEFDISFSGVCEVLKLSKKIRVLLLGQKDRWDFEERKTVLIGKEWDNSANISNLCRLDVWTGCFHENFAPYLYDNLDNFNRYTKMLSPNANSFIFRGLCWKYFNNPNYFTSTVKSTFLNFENLVELKLFAFLNDEILQFVCKHLTKLLVFEGGFAEVSDFGISGIREHDNYDSGISIANLKGLRRLCMYPAPDSARTFYITWDGLIKSIHFLELVDLRVRGTLRENSFKNEESYEDCRRNYVRLINKSRNPSLERVYFSFYSPDSDDHELIRKVNPRIKLHYDEVDFSDY